MELSCPLHLLFKVFDVSPTYWILHTLHVMTYITLLDLQWKFPLMGYEWLVLLEITWGVFMWAKSGILVANTIEIVWVVVVNRLLILQAYPLSLGFCCKLFVCFSGLIAGFLVICSSPTIFLVSGVGWGFLGCNWWWDWYCSVFFFF